MACGKSHSLFLTEDGDVYGCGYNKHYQLGIELENTSIPIKIPISDIVHIACGRYHSLFLTIHGRVFGCGSNKYDALGLGMGICIRTPTLLPLHNIGYISCMGNSSLFIDINSNIYRYGSDMNKRSIFSIPSILHTDDIETYNMLLPDMHGNLHNVVDIQYGYNFAMILTMNGDVYKYEEDDNHPIYEVLDIEFVYEPLTIYI